MSNKKATSPTREMQEALDRLVIGYMAAEAKHHAPRGDQEAAESAFCSEVAGGEARYRRWFPWLETGRKGRRTKGKKRAA